jgi:hypothetical protein
VQEGPTRASRVEVESAAGTRQESQRSVAEHANDHVPWRAGTIAALLGIDRRVFMRIDSTG